MKRKTNKNYKFGDALKEASPLFHAKYGKKGKYDKKGGDPKIRGGDEVITDKQIAIDAINKCTRIEALNALALRIVDLLDSESEVKAAFEDKKTKFEPAAVTEVVDAPLGPAKEPLGPAEGTETETNLTATGTGNEPAVEGEEIQGGKKAKKSAKKGKKSAKKGGKKAKKSAKKGKR